MQVKRQKQFASNERFFISPVSLLVRRMLRGMEWLLDRGKEHAEILVISADEKILCAGVPQKSDKSKQLNVFEWLKIALNPFMGTEWEGKMVSPRTEIVAIEEGKAGNTTAAQDAPAKYTSLVRVTTATTV